MKNRIYYLLFTSIFFFSCSEAKFGFLKKVKVESHTETKNIVKSTVSKPDIKIIDTDSSEIITANSSDENLILTQKQQTNFSVASPISSKKIVVNSINQKKKIDDPIPKKELNENASLGFLLCITGLIGLILTAPVLLQSNVSILSKIFVIIFLSFCLGGFILSLIGLIQILKNHSKYKGVGYSILGLIIGAIMLWLILLSISSISNSSPTGP